jgi:hypothetical protein
MKVPEPVVNARVRADTIQWCLHLWRKLLKAMAL